MDVREGTISFGEAETWYRVTGEFHPDDAAAPAPLVVLHGGPGATHDYVLSLADLAEEYALTRPPGLRGLVLADTAASWADFATEAGKLRAELPEDVQATLARHEAAGTYDDPEYMEACLVFYSRHVCQIEWPPEVLASFEWLDRDPTVYRTMNGPSEFHIIGSCKDWQVKDRLHEIDVPTLLVSGRYDEATPALQQVLLDGIAGSEWVCFEESSHMPHVEERERYMSVVGDWLARHD